MNQCEFLEDGVCTCSDYMCGEECSYKKREDCDFIKFLEGE